MGHDSARVPVRKTQKNVFIKYYLEEEKSLEIKSIFVYEKSNSIEIIS